MKNVTCNENIIFILDAYKLSSKAEKERKHKCLDMLRILTLLTSLPGLVSEKGLFVQETHQGFSPF